MLSPRLFFFVFLGLLACGLAAQAAYAQTLPAIPLPDGVTAQDGDWLSLGKGLALWGIRWLLFLIVGASLVIGAWGIIMPVIDWYRGRSETGDVFGRAFGISVILFIVGAIGTYGLTAYIGGAS